jgi:hypothetical protein
MYGYETQNKLYMLLAIPQLSILTYTYTDVVISYYVRVSYITSNLCAYVTEQVYKIPDNLMCNLRFHISYLHTYTIWKNVEPNYVHTFYRVQLYIELECLYDYTFWLYSLLEYNESTFLTDCTSIHLHNVLDIPHPVLQSINLK